MWSIIKKHYLFYFLLFLGCFSFMFVIGLLKKTGTGLIERGLAGIIITFILSIIIGTISYYRGKYLAKATPEILAKEPFKELINQFVEKDGNFIGILNNYTVLINYIPGDPLIVISVLFNPKPFGQSYTSREIKQMRKRSNKGRFFSHKYFWSVGNINIMVPYALITYKKLITHAEEMTNITSSEGLKPISFDEGKQYLP